MASLNMELGSRGYLESDAGADFRNLLEKLPAGAYTCDAAGLITYFNSRAADLWGRTPKLNDRDDRYCGSFRLFGVDGTPIAHDRCWMALALQNNAPYDGCEIVIERPDGQRLTALAHATPFHDARGQILGAVNVLVDISDRKASEGAWRTSGRHNDELLATLAHGLRNPLEPLRNAVQILNLHVPRTPETASALSVMDRQMRQMARLIDDLMHLSRITCNALELERGDVKLADVVHSALEVTQPLLEARGHRFTLQMPGEAIVVEGDAVRLSQVVSNLLDNAAKFTPRGGHITLKLEREGDHAVLTVRDTGVGIAPETLPRVFEMFAQGAGSPEGGHAGLGVGLTLVRRLVELHGGKVEALSEGSNLGAQFVVRLPVKKTATRSRSAAQGRDDEAAGTGLRILVVDDNVDAAITMAALLSMYGHDVRTAHDGLQALDEVKSFRPDVVILDIGMPKMNGYTVAKRIRERTDEVQPLLIAVTGWGQEEDRRRSEAAGIDHHLVKPVDPATLSALIGAGRSTHTLH